MPRINNNADDYAAGRLNIFFPAHNQTNADGNLTGQCVTLNKWFLAEMTDVPSPFAARGDARYVGDALVNQGHAVEVPYDQRRRGDFAVYKYGQYGHIGVILSGDRIFEQNANVGGVARRVVDGSYVYASRIGSLNESWRPVRPNIYRIKSYSEGGAAVSVDKLSREEVIELHNAYFFGNPGPGYGYEDIGTPLSVLINKWKNSPYRQNAAARYYAFDSNQKAIADLSAQVTQLNAVIQKLSGDDAADKDTIAKLQKLSDDTQAKVDDLTAKNAELAARELKATETGNAFMRWLGDILNKFTGKG